MDSDGFLPLNATLEELLTVSSTFLKLDYTLDVYNNFFDTNLNTYDEYVKVANEFKSYINATNLSNEQLRYIGAFSVICHLHSHF